MFRPTRKTLIGLGLVGSGLMSAYYLDKRLSTGEAEESFRRKIPTRYQTLSALKGKEYDLLIVGGGASGTGVALDAATRGLSVALVEREDFSSCTSSRSTKLIHGGVRYLENAFWHLDYGQYALVKEALYERYNYMHLAPHLTNLMPIMIPLHKWWQVPYYWVGVKCYDFVAGKRKLAPSYFLSKTKALEEFPMLRGDDLKGAIVYYDGQTNDSRMNVLLACTAAEFGADVANHVEAVELLKNEDGKLVGAKVRDTLSNEVFTIKAKGIVNATGPFCDQIRKMDNPEAPEIIVPSSGVHVILPDYFSPRTMGLLDPSTSDGRVIFFLPWEGSTLAGTTDTPVEITTRPVPLEQEIEFILKEVKGYLNPDISVQRGDVQASWSGIRPLVKDLKSTNTKKLSRTHVIEATPSGLLTLAGGKWTTYRRMAEDLVDKAIEALNLKPKHMKSITENIPISGAELYSETLFIQLVQQYGLETEIARHLTKSYGDKAFAVAVIAQHCERQRQKEKGRRMKEEDTRGETRRISPKLPYIDAEIIYGCRYEYACTLIDVIAHRTRIAFLNAIEADHALNHIANIMSEELKWDETRKKKELNDAKQFLDIMGLKVNEGPVLTRYRDLFTTIDVDHDGTVSRAELLSAFNKEIGRDSSEAIVRKIINDSPTISFSEFMDFVQTSEHNRKYFDCFMRSTENVDRSGGGL